MLFFLYGDNLFSLQKSAQKVERDFIAKENSDLNVIRIDGEKTTLSDLSVALASLPFLGNRRLLVIKNLSKNSSKELKKDVANGLEEIPTTSVTLFIEEGEPDKRESLFKELTKKATTKVFALPPIQALPRLIREKVQSLGLEIGEAAAERLALLVGADLMRLDNEIEKLILFARSKSEKEISISDINISVEASPSFKIFDLTDAIGQKNLPKALKVLHEFLGHGEDASLIFNMVIREIRNMLIISDLAKIMPEQKIASEAKMHPFVVKKTLSNLRRFQKGEIERYFLKLRDADWQIKSGQIEQETALIKLIVDFAK